MQKIYFISILTSLLLVTTNLKAQTNINVNTSKIIASGVSNKIGINLNAGADHDNNRAQGARSLKDAIAETGAKHIRYPGGNKSNYFAWTADPDKPDPKTNYWKGSYANNAEPTTLNFDEFNDLCREVGAEAHINVPLPTRYNQNHFTRDFLIKLAVSWVKYANITHKETHYVKYWELGNEMWNKDKSLDGAKQIEIDSMVNYVRTWSAAMKAVDPDIKIGVSPHNYAESQKFIDACGDALDYLCVSNYSKYGNEWENRTKYKNSYQAYRLGNNLNLIHNINHNLSLKSVVSEFGCITHWIENETNNVPKGWQAYDRANNVAKGIMNFDMVGQFLLNDKTEYACKWNTRWYKNKQTGLYEGSRADCFNNANHSLAVVQPYNFWKRFLKDDMVEISNGNDYAIVSYASYDKSTGELNVFLINKELTNRSVQLSITTESSYQEAEVWQYKGVDEYDKNPTIGKVEDITVSGNNVAYTLPSTSITVFSLKGVKTTSIDRYKTEDNIKIFPNPASEKVTIKSEGKDSMKSSVLYDTTGQQVIHRVFVPSVNEHTMDVNNLAKGAYILAITGQSGKRSVEKLMVN